ncbi:Pc23g00830 [Talaromyces islandicus]|uniref:Pc23g00830 n=1 Tax=Talaromyces islandicus TaxID=28573 RepID=A0A0U1M2Q6_TALIS|nr:Pc23g00830 [Talaromyces islandicus]
MTTEPNVTTRLARGLKRLGLPQVALQEKSNDLLLGWDESPWKTFHHVFTCDLAGSVSIVNFRTYPSRLRAIRTFKKDDADGMLAKFKMLRQENVHLAREYYNYGNSVYVVFDDLPLTLKQVVACDYYPDDHEVSSILAQILSGLSYLHTQGFNHRSLTYSNILLGMDGTIQIAGLEFCVKSSPNQSDSIEAVATIATLLMQKYEKSSGSKGIADIECWFVSSSYRLVAMSYSPRHDDNISPQPYESWDNGLLYAPTPGNFSESSSRVYSPSPSTFLGYPPEREPQSDQLRFIPPTLWDKDQTYDEQPPKYLHYLIEWKVTLNNRTITKVTEPDVVLAPGAYWQKVLAEKVERVENRRVFTSRRARLEDITVMASVLRDRAQKLHQQSDGVDIDWEMTEKQLLK